MLPCFATDVSGPVRKRKDDRKRRPVKNPPDDKLKSGPDLIAKSVETRMLFLV